MKKAWHRNAAIIMVWKAGRIDADEERKRRLQNGTDNDESHESIHKLAISAQYSRSLSAHIDRSRNQLAK